MKILLIEDDDSLSTLLTRSLHSQHYIVDAVKDGETGWTYATAFDYDSIILDIMLPKLDGISLCQRLRGSGHTTPILLLTAQDTTTAKVQGLDAGADDYMVKPFDLAELIARVRALRRRGSSNPLPLLSWGDLLLNPSTCDVSYNGQSLTLTTKEYDLLELFLRDSHHVFSSDEIIDRLWSSDDFPAEATVRSHLRRLRHKLQAAGAPNDLIGTIHGRGYYLKSPQQDENIDGNEHVFASISEQQIISPHPDLLLAVHETTDFNQQQQYLSFLQETWVTTKPQCLDQLTELLAIVDRLLRGHSSDFDHEQAHQLAHKLAGTLGVFSLLSAMEIARQIEKIFDRSTSLISTETAILTPLLQELAREIESNIPNTIGQESAASSMPQLLMVDLDPNLVRSLSAMANADGYSTTKFATMESATNYLSSAPDSLAPVLILINLAVNPEPLFGFIHNVHQRFPHWAVLVLSANDELSNRLAVVRHGGKFLSTINLPIERLFAAATSLFPLEISTTKVMVVDDDLDWLRSLPKLLQPWGMKVTTLANPQQFWTVLQLVQPDALILDVKMPEINGLELCQVLRSDPHWQHLPILFLTVSNDLLTQQAAFSVGADDYLSKPIMGGEIAQRIRHRLARLQAGQVAT
jgi:DNA-binding response OmpR family regulator/HPt (histidine-containing phosphotransfer) domain-containing protein